MTLERVEVVRKIDDLLETHCNNCQAKREYNREYGGNTSFITKHCSKCPIGIQLAELGQQLTVRPRRAIKLEIEMEEQNMTGQRMEKEGPSCGLTKQVFIEQIASGETVASVEKAWGMKFNTLAFWVKKWDLKGINADKARALLEPGGDQPLLREKHTLPQTAPDVSLLDKAEREIERLTAELENRQAAFKEMVASRDSVEQELMAAYQERDELQERLSEAKGALTTAQMQRGQFKAERDALAIEIERLTAENQELLIAQSEWRDTEEVLLAQITELEREVAESAPVTATVLEPSETHLLDSAIAELTRARRIVQILSTEGIA
ncbi:zinc-finger domain-containing protein [Paenibacillus sp. NFR01]|uniref:zinc-finger domain-containing protein n=1 Tax=Paenibacillus sp. NFR01 TaxID=1566279 RepID=UPI0008C5908B|nr:zinc-finger domain-containing protein [Paenibacillus sp. NFR01]SEU32451.1 Protein of unknown function [Paenibacillus sp. NFR01]